WAAVPPWPCGWCEGVGRPLPALALAAGFFDFSFTIFLEAALDLAFVLAFDFLRTAMLVSCLSPVHARGRGHPGFALLHWVPAFAGTSGPYVLPCDVNVVDYFFLLSALCGLRLPMRPLSLPAAGSSTALIKVGLPESIAAFTARFNSSGEVTLTPTPPKASIILS